MPVITDVSLCTIQYGYRQKEAVHALYSALLDLGINFVQIPASAVKLIGDGLVRDRTLIAVSADEQLPVGMAGYVCENAEQKGRLICEAHLSDELPAWADEVRITADASLFMRDYEAEFIRLLEKPQITFCPKDAGHAGAALAIEWLLSGGKGVVLSFLGSGGYAPLEQVLAALYTMGSKAFSLETLSRVAAAWERLAGQRIPDHSPVVGRRIFEVESGTHVDGILKKNGCYEPFAPEDVGGDRYIGIGKHSGKAALEHRLKELGIVTCDMDRLLELVRAASIQHGGSLGDDELKVLAAQAGGEDAA